MLGTASARPFVPVLALNRDGNSTVRQVSLRISRKRRHSIAPVVATLTRTTTVSIHTTSDTTRTAYLPALRPVQVGFWVARSIWVRYESIRREAWVGSVRRCSKGAVSTEERALVPPSTLGIALEEWVVGTRCKQTIAAVGRKSAILARQLWFDRWQPTDNAYVVAGNGIDTNFGLSQGQMQHQSQSHANNGGGSDRRESYLPTSTEVSSSITNPAARSTLLISLISSSSKTRIALLLSTTLSQLLLLTITMARTIVWQHPTRSRSPRRFSTAIDSSQAMEPIFRRHYFFFQPPTPTFPFQIAAHCSMTLPLPTAACRHRNTLPHHPRPN